MKRWVRRITRAIQYAKRYWRNTRREFANLVAIIDQLDQPARPAARQTSTRRRQTRQRRRSGQIVITIKPFTRANGTSVKRHTRRIKTDARQ